MGGEGGIGISGLGQVAVYVRSLPAAIGFYRDTLGLPLLFEAAGMAFLELGGVRLMLTEPNAADPEQRASILYLRVADIAAAWDSLMAVGTPAREAPQRVHAASGVELWLAFFEDPSGNVLALMEERRVA